MKVKMKQRKVVLEGMERAEMVKKKVLLENESKI